MTGARIDVADASTYASVVSRILQAAWKPPCLHYSPEYLAWQFSFPGDTRPIAAVALVEDKAMGCVATTSRRFRYAQTEFFGNVLSFVAVDPAAGGRGLASGLYAAFLDALPLDVPVIAFTEPGSVGEQLLIRSIGRANYRHRSLQVCRAVGYLGRSTDSSSSTGATVRASVTFEDFAAATRVANDIGTVWTDFTPQQWEHYRDDPRGRFMVVIQDGGGAPLGTAMIVSAEIVSAQGLQSVTMLESVALNKPAPDAITAMFRFAATRAQTGSPVIASNLSYIDQEVTKAAGARALPSSFNAHLFIKGEPHIAEQAFSLNLEII